MNNSARLFRVALFAGTEITLIASSGISEGYSSGGEGRLELEFAAEEEDADSVVVEESQKRPCLDLTLGAFL